MQSTSRAPFADPLWLTRPTANNAYQESHRRLQREARAYVDTKIAPFCAEWEEQGRVPSEVIRQHADLGYMAVSVYPVAADYLKGQRLPGDIDPMAWDGFHDLIVIDEIARCGYLGVIWALTCGNSIGAPPVINFGNKKQKEQFVPGIMCGDIRFCLAVTEPDGT